MTRITRSVLFAVAVFMVGSAVVPVSANAQYRHHHRRHHHHYYHHHR